MLGPITSKTSDGERLAALINVASAFICILTAFILLTICLERQGCHGRSTLIRKQLRQIRFFLFSNFFNI